MKLYANIKNTRGGKKGTTDDSRILIELNYGNKLIGEIGLYSIIDAEMDGYRVVWNEAGKGYNPNNVLVELEKQKGVKQKDEICKKCDGLLDAGHRCL